MPLPKRLRHKLRNKLKIYIRRSDPHLFKLCDALIGLIGVAITKAEAQKLFSKDHFSKARLNNNEVINELIAKLEVLLPENSIREILNNDMDLFYSTSDQIYKYIDFIHRLDEKTFLGNMLEEMYPCPANDFDNYLNSIHDLFIYKEIMGIDLERIKLAVLKDLLIISNALRDKNAFISAMEYLNAELIQYARNNRKILDETDPDVPTLPLSKRGNQHILCGYLKEWARAHNFNQNSTAKVHGFIEDTNIFSSLLISKEIFKDNGVEQDHGSWAHILQFYFIEFIKEKTTHSSAEIYQLMGLPDFQSKEGRIRRFSVWDNLFDMPISGSFRSPYNVTRLLTETELPSLSLLSTIIEREYYCSNKRTFGKNMKKNNEIESPKSLTQTIVNFFWPAATKAPQPLITHHPYNKS